MKHLRDNLLLQFSMASFVIMAILAVAISELLTAQLDHVVDLLVEHDEAMLAGASMPGMMPTIDEAAPYSIPNLERNVKSMRWVVFGVVGGGFVSLYGSLVLILLDLMMPEMDGFQFLNELRKREEWRSIPIVVVTAKDLTPEDRLLLNGHVEKILQKGAYSREALLDEVRHLVAACMRQGTAAERSAA